MNKSELKPALVFEQFAKINEIPRPSKHEENMIEFLKSFSEAHQLVHPAFYFLFLVAVGLVVKDITDFAFLSLYMSVS